MSKITIAEFIKEKKIEVKPKKKNEPWEDWLCKLLEIVIEKKGMEATRRKVYALGTTKKPQNYKNICLK